MKILHQIGDRSLGGNFNSLEEILAYDGPISFDGVYTSVYKNFRALVGKDVTFFFSGKYLGKDNSFDVGQPLSTFCTEDQIYEMAVYLGAKIGYHGWAHLSCPTLSDEEIFEEIIPRDFPYITKAYPKWTTLLAWPYGDVDERCNDIARRLGYKEGYSVYPKNTPSVFAQPRTFLNWDMYDQAGNNLGKQP